MKKGKLTKETFHSVIFSCKSLVSLIQYLPDSNYLNVVFNYILTSKFQIDCLESRFGIYTQLNGACYHITLKQIISSEKNES